VNRTGRLAFLKVLAAMAWADGEVDEEERNRIKILFNRFELDPADRKDVEALLDVPVPFERAVELTKDFASQLVMPGARKELLAELEAMAGAKKDRAPEETELLEHARAILASHTVVDGLVDKLRGVFRPLFAPGRDSGSPGRLTEYARNSALLRLRDLFHERGWTLDERLPAWNRVTLLGVLLARVARLGEGRSSEERKVIERVLSERLRMSEPERHVLLAVVEEEETRDTDLQRICSEYCRVSTMKDRLEILDGLFAVASADGRISRDEVEQIHRIADLLWISNPEYLAVRDAYRDRIVA